LTARLSPYALTTELSEEEVQRLSAAIDSELTRGLELRERGASDKKAYRIHNRLGEPCPNCGTSIARVDFDEHTIYYCPSCQTEGRILKDRRLSRLLR
jgi:formamidopyrimidine-DNA glycosylase